MTRRPQHDAAFWVSYSDLATGLLLIFILLVAFYINRAAMAEVQFERDQDRIRAIQEEIDELLARRDLLALRLERASEQANETLGREVFAYDPATQAVVVRMDDTEVAWFREGSPDLAPAARRDVRAFYRTLYEQMMCQRGGLDATDDPCTQAPPEVPAFLAAIEILGHTDPITRAPGHALWTWEAFNGTASRRFDADSNLSLAQARAKAIVDEIQRSYDDPSSGVTEETHPWRPFLALVRTSGRSWMSAYCDDEGTVRQLTPSDYFNDPPCPTTTRDDANGTNARSRRVSFGFRLDDKEILEQLQRLTQQVAELGGGQR